ncbi:MAG: outer membrane protein assembly factor [Limisphaerales bacterium]
MAKPFLPSSPDPDLLSRWFRAPVCLLLLLVPGSFAEAPAPEPSATSTGVQAANATPSRPDPGPDPDQEPADAAADPGEEDEPKARLTVTGLGWLDNLKLKNLLRQARPKREKHSAYDANFIEDGSFLLLNHVRRLGFLDARLTVRTTTTDGAVKEWTSSETEFPALPRPFAAGRVDFIVLPGVRFHYEDLQIDGLPAEDAEAARRFFIRTEGLLQTRSMRRFSHGELQEALSGLRVALQDEGYTDAMVKLASLDLDHATGAVRARINVERGTRYQLRNVAVRIRDTQDGPILEQSSLSTDEPFSRTATEDLEQRLTRDQFREGYADASVTFTEARSPGPDPTEATVDLTANVTRGPRVALGAIRFESPVTLKREESLAEQARLEGPWLDRIAADEGRSRLARRGAFRFVRMRIEPSADDPDIRDVVYELEPGKNLTIDLLAGYRSYDLLYGGIDLVRRDAFGLGHIAELRAAQSFKSTEGYVAYSIPDAFAEDVTVYSAAEFLIREELSFIREEFQASTGVRKVFGGTGHQAGIRYSYQVLRADDAPVDLRVVTFNPGDRTDVGAVTVDWALDRRDSAINPRNGYQLLASLESALPEFGGDSRYLRPELRGSYHVGLKKGRFVHLGLRYTAIVDPSDENLIPFNKRIFPGGQDSVRGYQRGEASPLNSSGEVIGAASALVWMLEFEQLLTTTWSVVGFVDGVGQTTVVNDLLWDEVLWSAGLGLRWNSFIGPVRLEYGYNLTPRDHDPTGTLHFSVGFPF